MSNGANRDAEQLRDIHEEFLEAQSFSGDPSNGIVSSSKSSVEEQQPQHNGDRLMNITRSFC